MRRTRSLILILISLTVCSVESSAQETISPKKRELIRKYLEVTGTVEQVNSMLEMVLAQSQKSIENYLPESLPGSKKLTESERAKMMEDTASLMKKFKELYQKKVNLGETMQQIMYPVMDKYLSEDDLTNLVAFYTSATGRRLLEVQPKMMMDSMTELSKTVLPKVKEITEEFQKEIKTMQEAAEKGPGK
jgi:uncharacterized protein